MKKNVKQIVQELLDLDPKLKSKEKELEKLVSKLLEVKPKLVIDKAFKKDLRDMLLKQEEISPVSSQSFSTENNVLQNIFYMLGGGVIAALVIVPGMLFYEQKPDVSNMSFIAKRSLAPVEENAEFALPKTAEESFDGEAEELGDDIAFDTAEFEEESEMIARTQTLRNTGFGGGGGVDEQSILAQDPSYKYGEQVFHSYRYQGEFPLEEELEVFKYTKPNPKSEVLTKLLGSFDLQGMDLGTFEDVALQNISFTEKRKFGHMVHINLDDGSLNISQNYKEWPQPFAECKGDYECVKSKQLKKEDIPSDKKIIQIAENFLDDHSFDLTNFGEAEIEKSWMNYMEENYAPDAITVKYPQIINNTFVYNESGQKSGISINIDIRYMKVAGLWGLKLADIEKQNVSGIENEKDLRRVVEQGGVNGYLPDNLGGARLEIIDLQEPEKVYLQVWKKSESGDSATEFIVPALLFSAEEKPKDGEYFQESVVVPLAEEFLEREQGRIEPYILNH